MNNLVNILNKDGKLVVTSRQIAENFEKRHSDVTKAIEDLINKEGCAEKIVDLYGMFIYTEYKNDQNGQFYKEYLLTRDGFSLLVMSFTGTKALEWKIRYIEAFNKMEEHIRKQSLPMTIEDMMIKQLEEQKKIKAEITSTKEDVNILKHKVDNQITLDHSKQRVIQKCVGQRVLERMKENEKIKGTDIVFFKSNGCWYRNDENQKTFNKILRKYFGAIYREIKNRFGVPSYRDIKTKDFELAINYIKNWIEAQELREAC